ncbi:hypothetical protein D3230_08470 [Leucobacter chromiireducens subsp. solipictus]|uniref:Uncharacterized protein n=1 Tax=Leucobacter chromiireducens subsp. solipictus TaxID=398235 RepID=A0ABS1SFK8_9MICO|nr:hypothetical protein [Leucobacter chromiireducens subsp. solipictus]
MGIQLFGTNSWEWSMRRQGRRRRADRRAGEIGLPSDVVSRTGAACVGRPRSGTWAGLSDGNPALGRATAAWQALGSPLYT